MKGKAMGRKAIKAIDEGITYMVTVFVILLIAFSVYALWDSRQIHHEADKSHYEIYKPTAADQGKSFKELQALNAEVIAWLSVYGTNISYPVTQGPDNMKYVSTNAEGLYSLSGSIFLNSENSRDFTDFNSILYGHHMAKKAMFGEIENFSERGVFYSHRYGNLYFNEKDHGLEFFAFIHTDAYDGAVFTPNVKGEERQTYLDGLLTKATLTRDIGVTAEDRIILLSTCSSSSTNGRDILAGRITDGIFDNETSDMKINDGALHADRGNFYCLAKEIPVWIPLLAATAAIWPIARGPDAFTGRTREKRTETEARTHV